MDQVSIKYTNIFQSKILQNLPKFGFLVSKQTIWQPCFRPSGDQLSPREPFYSTISEALHAPLPPDLPPRPSSLISSIDSSESSVDSPQVPVTGVMIWKMLSTKKNCRKSWRVELKIQLFMQKKNLVTLVFKKIANFFAQKSPNKQNRDH
jgi:hypothetical protein